jgi:hypothetical protein
MGKLLVLAGLLLTNVSILAKARHIDVESLDPNSRALFRVSMRWGDESWDPQTKFLRAPPAFNVRDSCWYALGLLLRYQPHDADRAAQILRAVIKQQYSEPGKVWDGTFRRSPEEPEPGDNAVMWRAYDPNWREFIGTTFAVILNEYPDRLPPGLAGELLTSINHAVEGEMKQGRLSPSYTNIALMYGYLWEFAAAQGHRTDWVDQSIQWQENVYKIFKQHDAFTEYNSPTYAGVDFFGTALWRDYGATGRTRSMGSEMEDSLWRATADFYNANLRNISGPYDRSYGMDMQSYVSVVGLCLGTVLDQKQWPLPNLDHPPVDHVADLFFVPALVVVDTRVPADAMKSFRALQGEHQVRRQISDERIATAWIGENVIYGGEITGHTRGVDAQSQFHPATVQWQMPGGQIVITASGDVSFRIYAPGLTSDQLQPKAWTLPGLNVRVAADAKNFTVHSENGLGEITYTGITRMTLNIRAGK